MERRITLIMAQNRLLLIIRGEKNFFKIFWEGMINKPPFFAIIIVRGLK